MGGRTVTTAPLPFGVLSVNFAERSLDEVGRRRHPRAAFLGLQSRRRGWTAGDSTAFVMILLRPPGVMRLFEGQGDVTGDALIDLGDLWGDAPSRALEAALVEAIDGPKTAESVDRWLSARLAAQAGASSAIEIYRSLIHYGRVAAAAANLEVSVRTLERRCRRDLGVSPKQLLQLERMQRSLRGAQGLVEAAAPEDFADQSHEIRTWRKTVGTTPGRYQRAGPSEAAAALVAAASAPDQPVFYL